MPRLPKKYDNDPEGGKEYRNKHRKLNYDKSPGDPSKCHTFYTPLEDKLVLNHCISDREISSLIGRSVRSIQMRRWRLTHGNNSSN